MTRKPLLGIMAGILVLAGCGGGGKGSDSTTPSGGATTTAPTATTTTEVIPAAVSPASVRGTLQRVWGLLQAGGIPSAAEYYDRRISRELSVRALLAALRTEKGLLAKDLPIVDGLERTDLGVLVRVHRKVPKGKPSQDGVYLLRRSRGRYVIAYDSYLAAGILAYTRDSEQRKIDPGAKKASPRAVTAAKAAVARYDALFAEAIAK